MADFFDRIIDGFFKRIKEERISHAKKKLNSNPEYKKATQELDNAFDDALSTIERLSKKYPEIDFKKDYYKDKNDSSIKDRDQNPNELKPSKHQNNAIIFKTLFFICVFTGIYYILTKSDCLNPLKLASFSIVIFSIGVLLFFYGVSINLQGTTTITKADKRYKSGMRVVGHRTLSHSEKSEAETMSKRITKSAIIFLCFGIFVFIVFLIIRLNNMI